MLRNDVRHFAAVLFLLFTLLPLSAFAGSSGWLLSGAETVTSLSVRTSGRCFVYNRSAAGIRVNGGEADEEVFTTLLRQISDALEDADAEAQPSGEPLLTVKICAADVNQTVSFYADETDRRHVFVFSSGDKGDVSGTTEAWRVGTILLACEGTQLPGEDQEP